MGPGMHDELDAKGMYGVSCGRIGRKALGWLESLLASLDRKPELHFMDDSQVDLPLYL